MIRYRKMLENDIAAGLLLCRSAGWNQLESDWKTFLHLTPDGNRVAVDESGKVVGTVATVAYEDHFSWIGMVLVDPSKKRQGIGTQLLREALRILEDQETIKLDATPSGREVYLKLGFKDEYTLCRMMAANVPDLPGSDAERVDEKNMALILKKDTEVFGASRAALLQITDRNHPELSFAKSGGKAIAYCFGRKGRHFTQVGPVVAETLEDGIQLATTSFKNISGPVILDVMEGSEFKQWLISVGFTEQRKLIRMYRGTNLHPGLPSKQFAILGPEFG